MRRFVMFGAVLSVLGGAPLHAQAPAGALSPDQVIAVRQSLMDLQSGVAGAMKATVESKGDVKPLAEGAKGLVASAKTIPTLFPVGTEKGHNTKAKAEVWANPADFAKAASNLEEAATKLVALAEAEDKAGFATQFVAVGRTCGGCHRTYKERD